MIKFLASASFNFNSIIEKYEDKIIEIIPTKFEDNYHAVIIKLADNFYRCIFKGNPEFILSNCKFIRIGA